MDNSDCQTLKRQPSESPSQSPKRHLRYDTPLLSNAEYIAGLDANREKLKATFEDIIQRYSRDFGEEADEIDIFREEIVVDRGFLRNAPYYKFGRGKSLLNPVGNPIPLKEEFPGNDIKGLPLAFTGPKEALDASAGFLWSLTYQKDKSLGETSLEVSSLFAPSLASVDYDKTTRRIASLLLKEEDFSSESSIVIDDLESIHSFLSDDSHPESSDLGSDADQSKAQLELETFNQYEVSLDELENLSLGDFLDPTCSTLEDCDEAASQEDLTHESTIEASYSSCLSPVINEQPTLSSQSVLLARSKAAPRSGSPPSPCFSTFFLPSPASEPVSSASLTSEPYATKASSSHAVSKLPSPCYSPLKSAQYLRSEATPPLVSPEHFRTLGLLSKPAAQLTSPHTTLLSPLLLLPTPSQPTIDPPIDLVDFLYPDGPPI